MSTRKVMSAAEIQFGEGKSSQASVSCNKNLEKFVPLVIGRSFPTGQHYKRLQQQINAVFTIRIELMQ